MHEDLDIPDFLKLTEEERRAGRRIVMRDHTARPCESRRRYDRPATWTPEAERIAREVEASRTADRKADEHERKELVTLFRAQGMPYIAAVQRAREMMR